MPTSDGNNEYLGERESNLGIRRRMINDKKPVQPYLKVPNRNTLFGGLEWIIGLKATETARFVSERSCEVSMVIQTLNSIRFTKWDYRVRPAICN